MEYITEIKVMLARKGYKVKDLCWIWGISRSNVSAIMNGKASLSVDRFQKVVDACGCKVTVTN